MLNVTCTAAIALAGMLLVLTFAPADAQQAGPAMAAVDTTWIEQTLIDKNTKVTVTKIELVGDGTRVFLDVENLGDDEIWLPVYSSAIVQDGRQYYSQSIYDTDDSIKPFIFPGAVESGYVMFDRIEEQDLKLHINGWETGWIPTEFVFDIKMGGADTPPRSGVGTGPAVRADETMRVGQTLVDRNTMVTVKEVEMGRDDTMVLLEVENLGYEEVMLSVYTSAIMQNGRQYDSQFISETDGGVKPIIPPGATDVGYLMFEDIEARDFQLRLNGWESGLSRTDFVFDVEMDDPAPPAAAPRTEARPAVAPDSSVRIGQTVVDENTRVTIKGIEMYRDHTMMLLEVENLGDEQVELSVDSSMIIQDGSQHNSRYILDPNDRVKSTIRPGAVETGYLKFDKIEEQYFELHLSGWESGRIRTDFTFYVEIYGTGRTSGPGAGMSTGPAAHGELVRVEQTLIDRNTKITVKEIELDRDDTMVLLEVENLGDDRITISVASSVIVQGARQYDSQRIYDSNNEVKTTIFPGVVEVGYLKFDRIEKEDLKLHITGSDSRLTEFVFDIDIDDSGSTRGSSMVMDAGRSVVIGEPVRIEQTLMEENTRVTVKELIIDRTDTKVFLEIENLGDEEIRLWAHSPVIIQAGKEYSPKHVTDADERMISNIFPGVTEKGYLKFDRIEERDFKLHIEVSDTKRLEFVFIIRL